MKIVGWLVPVAIALLLVTTSVRISANSLWLYDQLFERNQVPARTGISMATLRDIGAQIQDYFGSDTEPLQVRAIINGTEVDLFGEDEIAHMYDVKRLFLKTYLVQTLAGLIVAISIAAEVFAFRRRAVAPVASWLKRGAVIVSGTIAIIGVASVVAFNQVFLLFHYIGFPQGNFTFSTQNDYLVRVFPNGFWSDITFVIGVLTVAGAGLVFAASVALGRKAAPGGRASP